MQDFDSCLNQVCESVLSEVFGTNGSLLGSVTVSDCCRRPQEFDDALVDLLQPMGALLVETKILIRFYRSIGARYSRSGDLNFAEEVKRARLEFQKSRPRVEPTMP